MFYWPSDFSDVSPRRQVYQLIGNLCNTPCFSVNAVSAKGHLEPTAVARMVEAATQNRQAGVGEMPRHLHQIHQSERVIFCQFWVSLAA